MINHVIKVTKAGDVIRIKESFHLDSTPKEKGASRQKKHNKTSPSKQAQNNLRSQNNRIDKITSNYTNGDYFVTLTYNASHLPSSIEDAKQVMNNFIRSLRRWRGDLCYEMNLESGSDTQRFHHHMIIKNYPGVEEAIISKWSKYGHVHITRIVNDGDNRNIFALAVYFCKHDQNLIKTYKSSSGKKLPIVEFISGEVKVSNEFRCINAQDFTFYNGLGREIVYLKNTTNEISDYGSSSPDLYTKSQFDNFQS